MANALTRLIPRGLKQRLVERMLSSRVPPTFDGIFSSVAEVPTVADGYGNETFARRSAAMVHTLRASNEPPPTENNLVSVALGFLSNPGRPLRVLDFGGSAGIHYLMAQKALGNAMPAVDWTVVEMDGICVAGRELWPGQVTFSSFIPVGYCGDLVVASSSLQYSTDFRETLYALLACEASHVLLANTPIGDVTQSFVTRHVNAESLHCWIMALADIASLAEECGYELMFCGSQRRTHNPESFPAGYRIEHYRDVILRKKI